MPRRVSHSLLDPWLTRPLKRAYPHLPIPGRLPPEAIVVAGHLCALGAAVALAYSTDLWWMGLLAALGVAANHVCDVLDGTHARATGQCRNGGELLDHFVDPLSFSYWAVGLAVSCGRLEWALVGVVCIYATAVLTGIKAKIVGEFTLATFGPTEFKTLLVLYGATVAVVTRLGSEAFPPDRFALWFLAGLLAVGLVQLIVGLFAGVREVNRCGSRPDTTEWQTGGAAKPSAGRSADTVEANVSPVSRIQRP